MRIPADRPKPPRSGKKRAPGAKKTAGQKPSTPKAKPEPRKEGLLPGASAAGEVHQALLAALKAWRLEEARRRSVPAFQIFTDRSMKAVATSRPGNEEELLGLYGFGPRTVKKYGGKILKIVASIVK